MRQLVVLLVALIAVFGGYQFYVSRLEVPPYDGVIIRRSIRTDLEHPGQLKYEVIIGPNETFLRGEGPWTAQVDSAAYVRRDSLPLCRPVHFRFACDLTGTVSARIVP